MKLLRNYFLKKHKGCVNEVGPSDGAVRYRLIGSLCELHRSRVAFNGWVNRGWIGSSAGWMLKG